MAPTSVTALSRWLGGCLLFLGLPALLFGGLFLVIGGGEKEYDQCYYRHDPLVQRMFDEGLETSEGPELSHSVFPPGTICTWRFADGTSHVMGPSWVPTLAATGGCLSVVAGVILVAHKTRRN